MTSPIPKMGAPANWLKMIENIRMVRKKFPAPVDSMGCDMALHQEDPITWAAVQKLKEKSLCNVNAMLEAKEKDIEDLIYPVGFYRRKAVYLRKTAEILKNKHDGDIPNSVRELCELPGVGPKMAHLCMQEAWNINSGIGVDVHVHRITARLGWMPSKGIKTPEDTRKALESWLPSEFWREINHLLVGFGQTICTPLRPKCDECYNNAICPSSSTKLPTSATTTKKRAKKEVKEEEKHEGEEEEEKDEEKKTRKVRRVKEDKGGDDDDKRRSRRVKKEVEEAKVDSRREKEVAKKVKREKVVTAADDDDDKKKVKIEKNDDDEEEQKRLDSIVIKVEKVY